MFVLPLLLFSLKYITYRIGKPLSYERGLGISQNAKVIKLLILTLGLSPKLRSVY